MKIIKADVLGYCMGVKRAVDSAEKALEERQNQQKVYTLGPLIHNPDLMSSLEKRGASILKPEDINQLDSNSVVIIRAHGTTPQILNEINEKKAIVIDSTCPRVHSSQNRASKYAEMGFQIIIAGDKNHGEVTSISGYSKGHSVVIQNAKEAESLNVEEKAVLISQTTFSMEEFDRIEKILRARNSQLVVFNSICPATRERQNALRSLENQAEGILVIGGKQSANTRRLYEIALSICRNAALIENAADIPEEFKNLETVALTAGASTPDSVIDEVEKALLSYSKN